MQCGDTIPDAVEHALHLVVTAFMKGETGFSFCQLSNSAGHGGEVFGVEIETLREGSDGFRRDRIASF